jgi:ribonuclease BN (tRNA processing enzyme)
MKEFRFLAKLYGVRGSYPIAPKDGTKYGGNTACLFVRTPEHIVIIDAGSGIVRAGQDLIPEILEHQKKSKKPFHITLLFTHTHLDHLIGFPFFYPLYIPGVHLHFFGPASFGWDFKNILNTFVEPSYYPVGMDEFKSTKEFQNINENMVIYFVKGDPIPRIGNGNEIKVETTEMYISNMKYYFHPKDGTYIYKIQWGNHRLVHATDIEQYVGTDQRLLKFAEGCDVLIHDAQYNLNQYLKHQGYGHSNFEMACQAALKSNAKKLLLFHHDPNNDDKILMKLEKDAREIFPEAELAYEGWEWSI